MESAAKAALAIDNGIAENSGSSSAKFVAETDEKGDSNSRVRATLSKGFAEIGEENAFEEAVAHCVQVE